jgi:hypothetical protein
MDLTQLKFQLNSVQIDLNRPIQRPNLPDDREAACNRSISGCRYIKHQPSTDGICDTASLFGSSLFLVTATDPGALIAPLHGKQPLTVDSGHLVESAYFRLRSVNASGANCSNQKCLNGLRVTSPRRILAHANIGHIF